jgi:hypothetical protein
MRFAPLSGALWRRIEGDAVRIRAPRITHIIETMGEARRTRRRPRGTQRRVNSRRLIRLKASLIIDGPATRGQNPAKNRGSPMFPGREMHLQNAAKPGASRRDPEPRSRGIEIGPHRINFARFRSVAAIGFASSAPYPSLRVRLPALETPEPKIAPKTRVIG